MISHRGAIFIALACSARAAGRLGVEKSEPTEISTGLRPGGAFSFCLVCRSCFRWRGTAQ